MRNTRSHGFTLLELGLVLVVLSLLISGILTVATHNIRLANQKDLEMKLDAIESAVLSYRKANGFIPCPGDITLVETQQYFGFQGAVAGTCTGGTPAATFDDGSNTVAGTVPVRDLGLPDDYARDPWGGKFLYIVDARATSASGFAVTDFSDTSSLGSITVKDAGDNNITTTAVLLIMSFGTNGHGAYISSSRKFVGSTNTDEWENCGCNASASATFNSTFYNHPAEATSASALANYDDTVRYYLRSQLTDSSDIKKE